MDEKTRKCFEAWDKRNITCATSRANSNRMKGRKRGFDVLADVGFMLCVCVSLYSRHSFDMARKGPWHRRSMMCELHLQMFCPVEIIDTMLFMASLEDA